ncbi:hypothetical protein D3C78_783080 [compost metagenome]
MAAGRCRQQGITGAALDVSDARLAVFLVDEVTEVGAQYPVAHWLFVQHVEVALLINIFKLRMPRTNQRALLVEAVLGTSVVEPVRRHPRCCPGRKVLHVGGVAQAHLSVLTGLQAQAFDFPRVEHAAAKRLRQQATIVITQQWNVRQQLTHLEFSGRNAHLGRQASAPEIVCRTPVVVHRQQFGAADVTAAVQLHAKHGNSIQAETDEARGITRAELEREALGPLFDLALGRTRVAKIPVEIVIAQQQVSLGILEKTAVCCPGGQAQTQSQGRGGDGSRQGARSVDHYYCSPLFMGAAAPRQAAQGPSINRCVNARQGRATLSDSAHQKGY